MNQSRRFLLPLALAVACMACTPEPAATAPANDTGPLVGSTIGGPFALTDQDGKRVTDRDFAGKYRIVYFGYSFCPDVCPVDLQNLAQGLRSFEQQDAARAAKIQPIFITIDPARDTSAALKTYVAAFHPRLIGLTGTPAEIAAAAKAYAVVYRKAEGGGSTEYLMDHTRQAYLMGPDGGPIALLSSDEGAAKVAGELARWVR